MRRYGGVGGSYAVIVDDLLYAGRGNDGRLVGNQQRTADQLIELQGKQMIISKERAFLQTETDLAAIDRQTQIELAIERLEITRQRDRLRKQLSNDSPSVADAAAISTKVAELGEQLASLEQAIKRCQKREAEPRRLAWPESVVESAEVGGGGSQLLEGGFD
ncbi:MAG: hypothetical protein EA381_17200 [Planctomycetaceae bacterium]|nr:MAG: hypothetical protein EA381_17200 [Planctomycetaceae bacterium]